MQTRKTHAVAQSDSNGLRQLAARSLGGCVACQSAFSGRGLTP